MLNSFGGYTYKEALFAFKVIGWIAQKPTSNLPLPDLNIVFFYDEAHAKAGKLTE